MKKTDYPALLTQAEGLIAGVPYLIANLANVSALIYTTMDELNWAGFYLTHGDKLVLGPFQGKPACIEIPWGRGVCGTAAERDATQLVPDVHAFPGHIACDCASRSEIVVPLHAQGKIVGVLDMDSPVEGRFGEEDREGLEALCSLLEKHVF